MNMKGRMIGKIGIRANRKFGILFLFVFLVGAGMVLGQSTFSQGFGDNVDYSNNRFYEGYQDSNINNQNNNPLQRSSRDYRNDPLYNSDDPYSSVQKNDPYFDRYQSDYNSNYPDYYNRQGNGYNTFGSSTQGNSYNPQLYPAGYSGFQYNNPAQYWSGYGSSQCIAGQDLILQIAPGGCSPPVVRSDLLEEQNVPVFCKVSAVQINPLIDISRVRSLRFSGEYPEGISGVSLCSFGWVSCGCCYWYCG